MVNVLIPMAGKSQFFDDELYPFPKSVIEINGTPMIQLVLDNYLKMKRKVNFIFVLQEKDCEKYHIDDVLNLITNNNCKIIKLTGETKGAACSALMAINYIDNDEPLIVANGDQVIDKNFDSILDEFEKKKLDGGVICFEAIHPKWSYVRLDEKSKIVETAEKRPISKNAIAGFYYFKKGSDFVKATMISIENDANVNGLYFIAPTYNYMVLENKNLEIIKIPAEAYHSFYSPQKIKDYENFLKDEKNKN